MSREDICTAETSARSAVEHVWLLGWTAARTGEQLQRVAIEQAARRRYAEAHAALRAVRARLQARRYRAELRREARAVAAAVATSLCAVCASRVG